MPEKIWRRSGRKVCALALLFCFVCGSAIATQPVLLYGDVEADPADTTLDLRNKPVDDIHDMLQTLPKLPGLQEVLLGNPRLSFDQLKQLREAFPDIVFDWTMAYFGQRLSSADTAIDLGEWLVTEENFADFVTVLDCMPNLAKVDMYETSLGKKNRIDIDWLAQRYPGIRFGWTLRIGDHDVRTDATAFSTLHNRNSPTHKSQDFEHLKYCKDMLALDVGHNQITDIAFLEEMPQLKLLIIAINDITDITPLAKLTELEYLELFKNHVADIAPLQNLTKLKDLNLCFNLIQDYSPLLNMPNLERLWLYNSNSYSKKKPLPKEAIQALFAAHPDCHIDTKSYSTLGNWREHPRYEVIYKVFSEGAYIPF